jgi:hypothetical protein
MSSALMHVYFLFNQSTPKGIFRSTYFGKGFGIRISFPNADIGAEFVAGITSQKGIGPFFESQQTRNRGFSPGSLSGNFLHTLYELGVARFDALRKLGVRLRIFMGAISD